MGEIREVTINTESSLVSCFPAKACQQWQAFYFPGKIDVL